MRPAVRQQLVIVSAIKFVQALAKENHRLAHASTLHLSTTREPSGKMRHVMTANDIITLPARELHECSKKIGHIDDDVRKLAQDMIAATLDWEVSRDHEFGAALAAVQVGQLFRLIVIRND